MTPLRTRYCILDTRGRDFATEPCHCRTSSQTGTHPVGPSRKKWDHLPILALSTFITFLIHTLRIVPQQAMSFQRQRDPCTLVPFIVRLPLPLFSPPARPFVTPDLTSVLTVAGPELQSPVSGTPRDSFQKWLHRKPLWINYAPVSITNAPVLPERSAMPRVPRVRQCHGSAGMRRSAGRCMARELGRLAARGARATRRLVRKGIFRDSMSRLRIGKLSLRGLPDPWYQ